MSVLDPSAEDPLLSVQQMEVNVPKDLRKRVAKTETFDARGVVVDQWTAPWAVED